LLRGVLIALFAAFTVGPLLIWALRTLGVRDMGFWQFVGFKAASGAVLAGLITPLVALRALMDPESAPQGTGPHV